MGKIAFSFLDKEEKEIYLPQLFDLLYVNMQLIVPFRQSREQEKTRWLAEVSPALEKDPRQIILCRSGSELIGYFQYYIREGLLMVEEFQLRKDYQRTLLFYHFCRHIMKMMPPDLRYVEAYADKRNDNSRRIMEKLGMELLPEDEQSPFVHFRGDAETVKNNFTRQDL